MPTQVIPYLHIKGAAEAIEFYKKAFGATEELRLTEPGGKIGHAEVSIGGARVMLADEYPEHGVLGPKSLGGAAVSLALEVPDVDATARQAEETGAKVLKPVTDQFYGERTCKLEDPFGHLWHISTRTEELTAEEMQRRFNALFAGGESRG